MASQVCMTVPTHPLPRSFSVRRRLWGSGVPGPSRGTGVGGKARTAGASGRREPRRSPISAEALFILTDLCGLSPEDAIASAVHAARTLTQAAIGKNRLAATRV